MSKKFVAVSCNMLNQKFANGTLGLSVDVPTWFFTQKKCIIWEKDDIFSLNGCPLKQKSPFLSFLGDKTMHFLFGLIMYGLTPGSQRGATFLPTNQWGGN